MPDPTPVQHRGRRPTPRPGVLAIDAYKPGRASAPGVERIFKLSSNESPLGPSPLAIEAFVSAARSLALYPDSAATKLREAVAGRYGLDPARVICGAGSDDLLSLAAHAFVGPQDEGIFTSFAFALYKIYMLAAGGAPVEAPEVNYTANVDAILERVTDRTRIVFLANPNNPTGTYIPVQELHRHQANLPSNCLLVIDAAYCEYVSRADYSNGLELAASKENVMMTRTFSKIHGLAGLRVGWAYAPIHVCEALHRIREPFCVNTPAIQASVASLSDMTHVETARKHNEKWLPWLTANIRALGYEVTPSIANFILIHFPRMRGKTAKDADAFLTARGLILRRLVEYSLPDALRLSVGTEEANQRIVAALGEFASRQWSDAG